MRDKQEPDHKKPCKTVSGSLGFILRATGSQKGFKASQWRDSICVLELSLWCKRGEKNTGTGEGDGGARAVGERLPVDSFLLPTRVLRAGPAYDSYICKCNNNGYHL